MGSGRGDDAPRGAPRKVAVQDPTGPGAPARELARGRTSVVYDLGDGTVLRRCIDPSADVSAEATVMTHAHRHGVPVPRVVHASGPDLVMELVEGPTMLEDLLAHPDRAAAHGRLLAQLHRGLDSVPPVPPVRPGADERRLLHLDLHPGNVLLSDTGPVVVDWTNAASGPRPLDVATTWIVLACMGGTDDVRPGLERVRRDLLAAFLADLADPVLARSALRAAGAARLADPATSDTERRLITDLLAG